MNTTGFIKLHRSLLEHPMWSRLPFSTAQAWIDLLFLAAWKTHTHKGQVIGRGEVHASQLWLATRWGWHRRQVQRFLASLEKDEMCRTKPGTKGCTVTICNYELYQDMRAARGQPEGTTEEVKNLTTPPDGAHIVQFALSEAVDKEVFAHLKSMLPEDVVRHAGRSLKGKGQNWSPLKLGALLYAISKGAKNPVPYARTCMKSGSFPEEYEDRAKQIMAECRARAAERPVSRAS